MKTTVNAEVVNNQLRINGAPVAEVYSWYLDYPKKAWSYSCQSKNGDEFNSKPYAKKQTAIRNMIKHFKLEKELGYENRYTEL